MNAFLRGFFLLAELVSFIAICLSAVIFVLTHLPHFALCLLLVDSHFTSAKLIFQTTSLGRIRQHITICLKVKCPPYGLLSIHSANTWGQEPLGSPNWEFNSIWGLLPFPGTRAVTWETGAISYLFCSSADPRILWVINSKKLFNSIGKLELLWFCFGWFHSKLDVLCHIFHLGCSLCRAKRLLKYFWS